MKPLNEEHKKIQIEILKFLFDRAQSTPFKAIGELTKKPTSETQYHCDVLREQGFINAVSVRVAENLFAAGYEITPAGRKAIMEQ